MTMIPQAQERYLAVLIQNGQKVLFPTELFGKQYVWLQDPASKTIYLERLPEPEPTYSIDGQTGEVTEVRG